MTETPAACLDEEDRLKAARWLDRNVVVEAGAGTGKTTLLIERLAGLLLGRGLPVEKVVALTFTEKAAGEIKVRLAARLEGLVRGGSGSDEIGARWALELERAFGVGEAELRRRAAAALERLDRAPISTIHGFASRLLKLYPLEAGVDPSFEVDTGSELEEVFEEEWALWLEEELDEGSPRAERWLALLKACDLEDIALLARQFGEAKLEEALLRPGPELAASYRNLAQEARGLAAAHPPARSGGNKLLEALAAAAARCDGLAELLEGRSPAASPEPPLSFSRPAGWPEEDYFRAQALARVAEVSNPANELLLREALDLLRPFSRRLREGHARRGWMSFEGLLVKALDLVRRDRRVREALKGEFEAYLIDEFQDTDPLQGELILFLAERPGGFAPGWREVELGPGRLFVVGDPKQSIYRFRGADIAAFSDFVGLMRRQGAELCRLTVNFRSRPEIIEAVNGIVSSVMRPQPGFQSAYAPVQPARPRGGKGPAVEILRAAENGARAAELRSAEAEAVAEWVGRRRGQGDLSFKDVAVLLRSMTPLGSYLEAFRVRGIPYVVEGEKSFFQAQEVLDFFNLLHAIDDPGDARALAGVLRSPLAGLTDAELLDLKRRGPLDYRRPARDLPIFERLRSLRERSGRVPVGDLLEGLFEDPVFLGPVALAYHREQTLANLLKFRRLASEEGDRRGLTLKEFTRRLERSIEEWKEEGESPLADESFDAVRVLSIHKSKGLEFPVVILANLGSPAAGGRIEPLRLDWSGGRAGVRLGKAGNAAMGLIEDIERRKEAEESLRVLYVALTRAKERLVLAGADPAPGSLGAWLARAGAWPAPGAEEVAFGSGRIRCAAYSCAAPQAERSEIAAGFGNFGAGLEGLDPARYARLCRERQERFSAAPSIFLRPSKEGVEREQYRIEGDLAGGAWPADILGTLCHRVLEGWDFARPDGLGAAVAAAAGLLARERPALDWAGLLEEATAMLAGFFASEAGRELARSEIIGREVPFLYPLPLEKRGEEGRIVRGVIDVIYRQGGVLWAADYKTDRVEAAGVRERAALYRSQAQAYLAAVRGGLGPASFKLIFLRPALAVELGTL